LAPGLTTFRIAHLSDLHLTPPARPFRWADIASKRLLSRIAWRRKHHRHLKAVLDAITASVGVSLPDHVVITGDLTNFATPEEFEAARHWLAELGAPSTITVSPGNHDALVRRGAPDAFAPWAPWLGDTDETSFPHLRLRDLVAIVNLSSARPTAPHLAQGSLGSAQIEKAEAILRSTGEQGLFRIVLTHHPIASGVVSTRKALTDRAALHAVLARTGAELILHGHAHEAILSSVPGPCGPIPVLGVPSASTPAGRADQHPARWNEIAVSRTAEGFLVHVTARGVEHDLSVVKLGEYALV
jgi:3',5'-cyclic AMP phosphodiesterase CpdA